MKNKSLPRMMLFMALALLLLGAHAVLGQANTWNLRVTDKTTTTITVSWSFPSGVTQARLTLKAADGTQINAWGPLFSTSREFTGLEPCTTYRASVAQLGDSTNTSGDISIATVLLDHCKKKKKDDMAPPPPTPTPRPLANTCPELLPDIAISGYAMNNSQCQMVDAGGVGRMDLVQRGIVAAVDVWSFVPESGVEVCFRDMGAEVVFLDAAYSPRQLSMLDAFMQGGMTCAAISTTGTVVLLAS